MPKIIRKVRCRCGHRWWPKRPGRPTRCPECGDPNWDKPRKWTRLDRRKPAPSAPGQKE